MWCGVEGGRGVVWWVGGSCSEQSDRVWGMGWEGMVGLKWDGMVCWGR